MYDVSVWNIVVHRGSEKKGTSSSAKKADRGQFGTDVDAPRMRPHRIAAALDEAAR